MPKSKRSKLNIEKKFFSILICLIIAIFILFIITIMICVKFKLSKQWTNNLPAAPLGCHYQEVQCIKAPCYPILVCPTVYPTQTK